MRKVLLIISLTASFLAGAPTVVSAQQALQERLERQFDKPLDELRRDLESISGQRLLETYEATDFAHYKTQACSSVPYHRPNNFKRNKNGIDSLVEIFLTDPAFRSGLTSQYRMTPHKMRYQVSTKRKIILDAIECGSQEMGQIVSYYEDLQTLGPENLLEWIASPSVPTRNVVRLFDEIIKSKIDRLPSIREIYSRNQAFEAGNEALTAAINAIIIRDNPQLVQRLDATDDRTKSRHNWDRRSLLKKLAAEPLFDPVTAMGFRAAGNQFEERRNWESFIAEGLPQIKDQAMELPLRVVMFTEHDLEYEDGTIGPAFRHPDLSRAIGGSLLGEAKIIDNLRTHSPVVIPPAEAEALLGRVASFNRLSKDAGSLSYRVLMRTTVEITNIQVVDAGVSNNRSSFEPQARLTVEGIEQALLLERGGESLLPDFEIQTVPDQATSQSSGPNTGEADTDLLPQAPGGNPTGPLREMAILAASVDAPPPTRDNVQTATSWAIIRAIAGLEARVSGQGVRTYFPVSRGDNLVLEDAKAFWAAAERTARDREMTDKITLTSPGRCACPQQQDESTGRAPCQTFFNAVGGTGGLDYWKKMQSAGLGGDLSPDAPLWQRLERRLQQREKEQLSNSGQMSQLDRKHSENRKGRLSFYHQASRASVVLSLGNYYALLGAEDPEVGEHVAQLCVLADLAGYPVQDLSLRYAGAARGVKVAEEGRDGLLLSLEMLTEPDLALVSSGGKVLRKAALRQLLEERAGPENGNQGQTDRANGQRGEAWLTRLALSGVSIGMSESAAKDALRAALGADVTFHTLTMDGPRAPGRIALKGDLQRARWGGAQVLSGAPAPLTNGFVALPSSNDENSSEGVIVFLNKVSGTVVAAFREFGYSADRAPSRDGIQARFDDLYAPNGESGSSAYTQQIVDKWNYHGAGNCSIQASFEFRYSTNIVYGRQLSDDGWGYFTVPSQREFLQFRDCGAVIGYNYNSQTAGTTVIALYLLDEEAIRQRKEEDQTEEKEIPF